MAIAHRFIEVGAVMRVAAEPPQEEAVIATHQRRRERYVVERNTARGR
jgi:hypothetical protein